MICERSIGSRSRQAGNAAAAVATACRALLRVSRLHRGNFRFGDRLGKLLAHRRLRERTICLGTHRQAATESLDGRRQRMTRRGQLGIGDARPLFGAKLGVGRSQQRLVRDFVGEARAEPRLVRRVFQQPADEIGHAGDHLADGGVLPDSHAVFAQREAELIAHARELLSLQGRFRQIVFFEERQDERDGADIVRAGGQLDAALAGLARHRLDDSLGHPLETSIGFVFFGPDGRGVSQPLGADGFIVPIGAFDQPHGDLPAGPLGPGNDPLDVVLAASQIGLHGQGGGEVDRLAATLEQGERQILIRRLLDVEGDHHVVLGRGLQNRAVRFHQGMERSLEVDRIGPGAERTDFDRYVGARNGAEIIGFEHRVGFPRGGGLRQIFDQVEVAALIGHDFLAAQARFAQQIDAEGHALVPQLLQIRQGGRGVHSGHEVARHRGDPTGDRLGHQAFGQSAGLQPEVHAGRQGDAGLAEIIGQIVVDQRRGLEHGKNVDEAEQLDLEGRVFHGPIHQLILPESGGEYARLEFAGRLEQLAADFTGSPFDVRRGDCGRRRGGLTFRRLFFFTSEPRHYKNPWG